MKLFIEAGVPDGVINFVPGSGGPYGRRVLPQDTVATHKVSLRYIIDALADADGKTVVVTHHAPSYKSIGPRFHGDDSNCAYESALDGMIEQVFREVSIEIVDIIELHIDGPEIGISSACLTDLQAVLIGL